MLNSPHEQINVEYKTCKNTERVSRHHLYRKISQNNASAEMPHSTCVYKHIKKPGHIDKTHTFQQHQSNI